MVKSEKILVQIPAAESSRVFMSPDPTPYSPLAASKPEIAWPGSDFEKE